MNNLLPAIFLLYLSAGLAAQDHVVSGTVNDQSTGKAIQDVTVYINGTTRGTITDQRGDFIIRDIALPCELVISHVSYGLVCYPLEDPGRIHHIQIGLEPVVIPLEEVRITESDYRDRLVNIFKNWLLGSNYRKLDADILNDSVLFFNVLDKQEFDAHANAPLQVSLPQTGYLLRVDLKKFQVRYNEDLQRQHCSILGMFYFKEEEFNSRWRQRRVARKRVEGYYNTRMHFCRSLYRDKLAENGYRIMGRECSREYRRTGSNTPLFEIDYSKDRFGNPRMILSNIQCASCLITYHFLGKSRPADLNEKIYDWAVYNSELWFNGDSITIYPSGRVPENTLVFGGSIGEKGVASMLPDDYVPSMQ